MKFIREHLLYSFVNQECHNWWFNQLFNFSYSTCGYTLKCICIADVFSATLEKLSNNHLKRYNFSKFSNVQKTDPSWFSSLTSMACVFQQHWLDLILKTSSKFLTSVQKEWLFEGNTCGLMSSSHDCNQTCRRQSKKEVSVI